MKCGLESSDRLLIDGVKRFCSLLSKDSIAALHIESVGENDDIEPDEQELEHEFITEEDEHEIDIQLNIGSMEEIVTPSVSIQLNGCREIARGKFESIILPAPFSQSGLNKDRGSSACAVIAITVGCVFSRERNCCSLRNFLKAFVGCMEFGNSIHQEAHYLSVHEAILMMPQFSLMVYDELNWFVCDFNERIIDYFGKRSGKGFVVIVSRGMTVCITLIDDLFYLFDSHCCEPDMGATIMRCKRENLDMFSEFLKITPTDPIYSCYIVEE